MWHSARGAASFQGVALMMIQRVQNLIAGDKNNQFLLSAIHYTSDLPPGSFYLLFLPWQFASAARELPSSGLRAKKCCMLWTTTESLSQGLPGSPPRANVTLRRVTASPGAEARPPFPFTLYSKGARQGVPASDLAHLPEIPPWKVGDLL